MMDRPITTYSKRGVSKPGVNPESHAIVYSASQRPTRLASEVGMTKEALAVETVPGQKLDPMSRANFEKVYTVEHNIKVQQVGMVAKQSLPKLKTYWNEATQ